VTALADAQVGDLVFCHSEGIVGHGIRLVERFRRDWVPSSLAPSTEAPGDDWNHVAVLMGCNGEAGHPWSWTVGQAEAHGVTVGASLEDIAPGGKYEVVALPTGVDRVRVAAFVKSQVGSRYGFVTIASILITLLTPRFLNVMLPGTWICSAVAGEAMRYGGWLRSWGDIYTVSPAELWMAVHAR
jgi:hypothetical protein